MVEKYSKYSVAYVELTDMGLFHRRDQLAKAVELVKQSEREGPTHVVVFVHGWKHNASYGDPNVVDFTSKAMPTIADAVSSREGGTRTVGIFVGWRGTPLLALHDLSFHDRKSSADHVAKGSLRELLGQLRAIRSNQNGRVAVTLVGHSFGGLILFSAISGSIMDSLTQASSGSSLDPAPANPIYDAAVLLNPAFEGIRFEPLFQVAKDRGTGAENSYWPPSQRPLLVSITSRTDGATRTLFPLVRFFNSVFQREILTDQDEQQADAYHKRVEKLGNTHTMGHLERYTTHSIQAPEVGGTIVACSAHNNKHVSKPSSFPLWNMSAAPDLIPTHNAVYDPALWSFIASLSAKGATGATLCNVPPANLAVRESGN